MPSIDIGAFEDTFVIHFGGEFRRINAYTLASTLVALANAAKAANAQLNPGYEIEVVVEAFGEGSFRTKVRALYRGAGNLFTQQNLKAIVLSVIATFVYEHTLAPDRDIVVNVSDSEVVIEQGDTRIVVPRHVHEAAREVEDVPEFRQGIGHIIKAAEEDPDITDIAIAPHEREEPPVKIPRERFPLLSQPLPGGDDRTREVEETTVVRIIRAILQRSRRRWEFVWNGVSISAPVIDDDFYNDFFAHRITIAPGDALEVRLRVRQRLNPEIGAFLNEAYEIVEVVRHIPRAEQDDLEVGRTG